MKIRVKLSTVEIRYLELYSIKNIKVIALKISPYWAIEHRLSWSRSKAYKLSRSYQKRNHF